MKKCKSCAYFRYLVTADRIKCGCMCIMYGGDVEIDDDTNADDCEEYKSNK